MRYLNLIKYLFIHGIYKQQVLNYIIKNKTITFFQLVKYVLTKKYLEHFKL